MKNSNVEQLRKLIIEALKLVPPDAKNKINWSKIKSEHSDLWQRMMKAVNNRMQALYSEAYEMKKRKEIGIFEEMKPFKDIRKISPEIKNEILRRVKAGEKGREVCAELGVHISSFYGWRKAENKKSKKVLAKVVESLPKSAPIPTLNFCPHCGFPISPVIKAVTAVHLASRGGVVE